MYKGYTEKSAYVDYLFIGLIAQIKQAIIEKAVLAIRHAKRLY